MIGHHTRLRRNDDLLRRRAPAIKKKPPFFNVRAVKLCAVRMHNAILRNDHFQPQSSYLMRMTGINNGSGEPQTGESVTRVKPRLHRRFLSQQLNAIFVALKLQPAAISLRF